MAHWLTPSLCLIFCFVCVRGGVIHADVHVDAGFSLGLDTPDSTGETATESNGSSLAVDSQLNGNVSENVASDDNAVIFKNDTVELFGDVNKSIASSDGSPFPGSSAGESLIDASSVAVFDEPSLTGDKTTQFTTDVKSTEKFSSQIPPDSPTPTLSSVTNSSLVAKESVTAEQRIASSNTSTNDVPDQTTPQVNAEITDAFSADDAAAVGVETTGTVLDATLDITTTSDPVVDDLATMSTPLETEVDLVQNLPVLSKTTDGFDLIMDSTIEAAINDNVKLDTNTADPATTQATQIDLTSAPSLESGTNETIEFSTDNVSVNLVNISPAADTNVTEGYFSPTNTTGDMATFETAQENTTTNTSNVLSSFSEEVQAMDTGIPMSVTTSVDTRLETTTSVDNIVNAQIKTTEKFTEPVMTSFISTEENLQSTENPTASTKESSLVSSNGSIASSTEGNVLFNELSTDASVQNQEEVTNSVKQTISSAVVHQTTSAVPVDQTASGATDIIVQTTETKAGTDITVDAPTQTEITTEDSPAVSTSIPMTDSAKVENTGSIVSDITSQISEPTESATRETTPQATILAEIQSTTNNLISSTEELISAPTASTNDAVTSNPDTTTTEKLQTTEPASSASDLNVNIETTKSMISSTFERADLTIAAISTTDSVITSTPSVSSTESTTTATTATTTTTSNPTTTTEASTPVSTTQRPCPVFKTKYNRNDLVVTTEPEGCTMISKIVDLRGQFKGPNRMIWRKMHAGLRGLRYPDVEFKYEGTADVTDETCRMPAKSVGPYIVVDTIPGRCQMVIGLRSVRAPIQRNNPPGKKGPPQRLFRFRLVMRPVVEYLEGDLL